MQINEIKRKIDILNSYIQETRTSLLTSTDDFLANNEKIRALERRFQLIVDEAVDINTLILSDSTSESPESYRSTFYAVSNIGILDREFADRISQSAKLRNQIVHNYDKVQDRIMVEDIKKYVPMYEKYVAIVIEKFVSS